MNSSKFIIVNPAADSGRLKKKWKKYQINMEKISELEVVYTNYPQHGMELVKKAVDKGYKEVFTIGGDGIANEVANSILSNKFDIKLGMLPAGTSNDFHIAHKFPTDPVEVFKSMQDGKFIKSEVGRLTGDFDQYFFLIHADCGISAMTAKAARDGSRILKGEFKYTYYAIKSIMTMKKNHGILKIDNKEYEEDFNMIAVGMSDQMSGYKLWPENYPQRGDFGINFAYGQNRRELLKILFAAEKGKHIEKPRVEYIRGKTIEITLDDPWCFQAEGEIFTEGTKYLKMEHMPNALNVLVPNDDFVKGKEL